MQRNNNLSPLPWYRNINEQNHFKSYAYGEVYPLYWPLGNVPAFQVIIPHGSVTVSDIQLVNCEDGRADEIMSDMTGLTIDQSIPYFSVDMVMAIMNLPASLYGDESDSILCIETEFCTLDREIEGKYYFIPKVESCNKLLANLGFEV